MSGLPPISVPRASKRKRIAVTAICVIGVLALVAFLLSTFGDVHGTEFSPQRFLRRDFSYYRIPLVNLQVTPIQREDSTNDLERYLWMKRLIPKDPNSTRWDLVRVFSSGHPLWDGDARLLCSYLDSKQDDGSIDWLEWTKENMAMAQVLWPVVAQVSRQRQYFLVPDIMELAHRASDANDLQRQLRRHLNEEYAALARTHQELDEHERAIRLFGLALQEDGQSVSALLGRADSYAEIGKQEEARIDRALAEKLEGGETDAEVDDTWEADAETSALEDGDLSEEDPVHDDADFTFGF